MIELSEGAEKILTEALNLPTEDDNYIEERYEIAPIKHAGVISGWLIRTFDTEDSMFKDCYAVVNVASIFAKLKRDVIENILIHNSKKASRLQFRIYEGATIKDSFCSVQVFNLEGCMMAELFRADEVMTAYRILEAITEGETYRVI